jgi:hypothetical protein
MGLRRRRGNHSSGAAVVVVVHEGGAGIFSRFRPATTVASLMVLVERIFRPLPIETIMNAAVGKGVKGMHPPREMVVPLFVQPVNMRLFFVARWPRTSSDGRRPKFGSELTGRGRGRARGEGVPSRVHLGFERVILEDWTSTEV